MKNILVTCSLIFSIAALTYSVINERKYELAYIEAGRIYSEFQMSKELNKQFETVISARKQIIDSLMEQVRIKGNEIRYQKKQKEEDLVMVKRLEEECYYKAEQFEKQNREAMTELNTKIWNQINQYVSDFGIQKKYSFVFGATGQGNLMFANKELDLTDEVLEYINNKYNDKTTK